MRKCMEVSLVLCVVIFFIQVPLMANGEEKVKEWPKVGSIYKYSGVDWNVRGVGKIPFEYTATGESLSVIVDGTSGAIVIIPKKDQVVRCDPTVPMLYVDKVPDPDLNRNSYFKKTAKDRVWLLLELKRN
jgi:hypothetical protein